MNLIYLLKMICIIGLIVSISISTTVAQIVSGEVKITEKKDFSQKSDQSSSKKKKGKKRKTKTKGRSKKKKPRHPKKRKNKKQVSSPERQNSIRDGRQIR